MNEVTLKEMCSRNANVDSDLLRRAQDEMKRVVVESATFNLEPAFSRQKTRIPRAAAAKISR